MNWQPGVICTTKEVYPEDDNLGTVFVPTVESTSLVDKYRAIALTAHREFDAQFEERERDAMIYMPNYEIRSNQVLDLHLSNAMYFYPPVFVMESICRELFKKPLFITGGIEQLMLWGGLPATVTQKDRYQFDDRCNRDVDMKTTLTEKEFTTLVSIVEGIYANNQINGWVVENKEERYGSYSKLEFRQIEDDKEIVRAQVHNIVPRANETSAEAVGRYIGKHIHCFIGPQ